MRRSRLSTGMHTCMAKNLDCWLCDVSRMLSTRCHASGFACSCFSTLSAAVLCGVQCHTIRAASPRAKRQHRGQWCALRVGASSGATFRMVIVDPALCRAGTEQALDCPGILQAVLLPHGWCLVVQ